MSKVYVVQDLGKVNLLAAEEHGELVACLRTNYSHLMVRKAYALLRDKMRDITRDDFIVPIGNPAFIAFAGSIMKEKTGVIRILSWDGQMQRYYIQEVD